MASLLLSPAINLSQVSLSPAIIANWCCCHRRSMKIVTRINRRWHRWTAYCQCRWHRWSTFTRDYLREFPKKFKVASMVYLGTWGTLIHEKTWSRKSLLKMWIRAIFINFPNFFVFGFMKQTETNPKQILFRFVSVQTKINFCLFRGHPSYKSLLSFQRWNQILGFPHFLEHIFDFRENKLCVKIFPVDVKNKILPKALCF
jgi:hypothetical protein